MIVSFSFSIYAQVTFQKDTLENLKITLLNFDPFLDERKCSDSGWSDQRVSNSDDWPLYQWEKLK